MGRRSLLRRYPDFDDMRAALALALWEIGKLGDAETNWGRVDDVRCIQSLHTLVLYQWWHIQWWPAFHAGSPGIPHKIFACQAAYNGVPAVIDWRRM